MGPQVSCFSSVWPQQTQGRPFSQPRPSEPSQLSSPPTPADTFFWGQRLLALQPSSELPDSAARSRPHVAVGPRAGEEGRREGARPRRERQGSAGAVRRGLGDPGAADAPRPRGRTRGGECATTRPTHAGWLAPGRAGRVALTKGHLKRDKETGSL